MHDTRVIKGALVGSLVGMALAGLLIMAAVFAAVQQEASTHIAGLVNVDYVAGSNGGFDFTLQGGPGLLALIMVGGVVGAGVGLARRRRAPRGSLPC